MGRLETYRESTHLVDGPRIECEINLCALKANPRNGEGLLETQVRSLEVFRFREKAKTESSHWLPLHRSHCQQNWNPKQTAPANRQASERRLRIGENAEGNVLQMKITQKEILRNGNPHTEMSTAAVSDCVVTFRIKSPSIHIQGQGVFVARACVCDSETAGSRPASTTEK